MQEVNIELQQSWDTLDSAIDYFLDIVLDLKALKRLPELPADLFLEVKSVPKMPEGCYDNLTITLTSL